MGVFLQAEQNDLLLSTVRQAGIVARMMQHRIKDEGKADATHFAADDDLVRARRAAKTAIDEVVQELLLDAVRRLVDPTKTGLDAEEATPSVGVFLRRGEGARTVVIDPIDGTYEYLHGKNTYSICIGLHENKKITCCSVYFPAQNIGYLLPESGVPTKYSTKDETFEMLTAPAHAAKVVYKNSRVPKRVVERLRQAGFTVKDDAQDGVWGAMLSCLEGTAAGYICHTRNVRDIFLGPIIAALPEGFALDWQGNEMSWPPGGRIDTAVFGANSVHKDAIIRCLKDSV